MASFLLTQTKRFQKILPRPNHLRRHPKPISHHYRSNHRLLRRVCDIHLLGTRRARVHGPMWE